MYVTLLFIFLADTLFIIFQLLNARLISIWHKYSLNLLLLNVHTYTYQAILAFYRIIFVLISISYFNSTSNYDFLIQLDTLLILVIILPITFIIVCNILNKLNYFKKKTKYNEHVKNDSYISRLLCLIFIIPFLLLNYLIIRKKVLNDNILRFYLSVIIIFGIDKNLNSNDLKIYKFEIYPKTKNYSSEDIELFLKNRDFRKFSKNHDFSKVFQIFSIFSSIFLWISKNFDVLES